MSIFRFITKHFLFDEWTLRYKDIIVDELKRKAEHDPTAEEAIRYLTKYDITMIPYMFARKYRSLIVKVYEEEGYPYVIHNEKKLFLKRSWPKYKCRQYYRGIMCEQDPRSPHCYLKWERFPNKEDIIADVGAAEGIFALDVIDCCKKIYLFEVDDEWMIPLQKTFANYRDKVEIVMKYVGAKDSEHTVSMDSFFHDLPLTYVKADIEGAEEDMLRGGDDVFRNKIKKAILCTYHRPNDEVLLRDMLREYGFKCEYNDGYCLFIYDSNTFYSPYVRKAVLYGEK